MNKVVKFIRDNYIAFVVYAFIGWLYEEAWFLFVEKEVVNRGALVGPYLPIYGFGMLILLLILNKYKAKKHKLSDELNGNIAVISLVTFIVITVIEYTTPKAENYNVLTFFGRYWLVILLPVIISLIARYLIVHKTKLKKIKNIDVTPIIVCLIIWIVTTLIEYVSHYVIDVYFGKELWNYAHDFLNINARVNFDASRNFAIGGAALLYFVPPLINKITKSKNKYVNIIVILVAIIMFIDVIYSFLIK